MHQLVMQPVLSVAQVARLPTVGGEGLQYGLGLGPLPGALDDNL